MPYKSEHIKLPRELDRRVKITDTHKSAIKKLYDTGLGIREISRRFAGICSRRSIQFILFPDRLKQLQDKHRAEEHWKTFYNRKQLTKAVANLRKYKHDLYKKGIIS